MKKRIRVLMVLGDFTIGGAQKIVSEIVINLDKSIFDTRVLCINGLVGNILESTIEKAKIDIQYLTGITKVNICSILIVYRALNQYKPEIIHAHLGGFVFVIPWAITHKCHLVLTLHTKPKTALPRLLKHITRFLVIIKKITIVSISKTNQELTRSFLKIDQVELINNGIDISVFSRTKHDRFTFINVGRQDENKNQIMIIKAFRNVNKKYPNSKLLLVGDGILHDELIEQADQNENIEFIGQVDNVNYYLSISDCFVLSSHREGLPLSVIEAMASGLVVISTDVGGLSDLISSNGALIGDNDGKALESEMLKIIGLDCDDFSKMSNKSIEIASQYTSSKMAEQYGCLYSECVRKSRDFK